jgi:hypothetical protein
MNFLKSPRTLKRMMLYRSEGPRIIRQNYRNFFGEELTDSPRTISEKINHRMIDLHRQDNPTFTRLADKLLVRDFVKERVGEEHLSDLLWSGTNPAKIPFDTLPDRCMAKTNHASGFNCLLERPVDRSAVVRKFRRWLRSNYYFACREAQYRKIKPSILIEPFIDGEMSEWPYDYRLWCFNGKPEAIQVDNHAHDVNPFFDLDWNRLPFSYRNLDFPGEIPRPRNLRKMIEIAASLSAGFDFVRVDLFHTSERIIFGELTFTPLAGLLKFIPARWDGILGEKWKVQPARANAAATWQNTG